MPIEGIPQKQVRRVLRLSEKTLVRWHADRSLVHIEGKRGYDPAVLNEWLAGRKMNFTTPPTIEQLLSKQIVLLLIPEVMQRLKLTRERVMQLVQAGQLEIITLGRDYRISLASVIAYRPPPNSESLTWVEIEYILGIGHMTLQALLAAGKLTRSARRVSRASVEALLRNELLPAGESVDAWIEDQLADKRKPLSVTTAAANQAEIPILKGLVAAGKVRFIKHAATGRPLISPSSLLAWIERTQIPFTDEEFGAQFGVSHQAVSQWKTAFPHVLVCSIHVHSDSALYRSCMIGIVRPYLPSGYPAAQWVDAQRKGRKLLDVTQVMERLGLTSRAIAHMRQRGELLGIRNPWRRVARNTLER